MTSIPVRIISAADVRGPSDPVRIANWSDFVTAVAAAIACGGLNGVFDTLQVGDVAGGNYFEIESDGTFILFGDATRWDDLEGSLIAKQLTSPAGRIDYNFTELTADFQNNAIYPTDLIAIVSQVRHRYELGTDLKPHLHFIQNQNTVPNWLISYRVIENGGTVGAFALATWDSLMFTYPGAGSILQIAEFPVITGLMDLSFAIDVKLFRDTTNVSGLFAGADPYVGDAAAKFFDVHFRNDSLGSREEDVK